MEIVTYVRAGVLTHEDSLGNAGAIAAGEVQVMSAGTGIVHAERNRGHADTTLFQIWIEPARRGATPRWATAPFSLAERRGRLVAFASGRTGDAGALPIEQDAAVLGGWLKAGDKVAHELGPGRAAYLVPALGTLEVNGRPAPARAGVEVSGEERIVLRALEDAEVVLVDVAV
jgi:redox-sensitive bicupin YhaK (pirin superfamily)